MWLSATCNGSTGAGDSIVSLTKNGSAIRTNIQTIAGPGGVPYWGTATVIDIVTCNKGDTLGWSLDSKFINGIADNRRSFGYIQVA